MVNFTNFQRVAAAAIGAIILSTSFVGAAVVPAHAIAPSQVSAQATA
jgi:hypothetical protein